MAAGKVFTSTIGRQYGAYRQFGIADRDTGCLTFCMKYKLRFAILPTDPKVDQPLVAAGIQIGLPFTKVSIDGAASRQIKWRNAASPQHLSGRRPSLGLNDSISRTPRGRAVAKAEWKRAEVFMISATYALLPCRQSCEQTNFFSNAIFWRSGSRHRRHKDAVFEFERALIPWANYLVYVRHEFRRA